MNFSFIAYGKSGYLLFDDEGKCCGDLGCYDEELQQWTTTPEFTKKLERMCAILNGDYWILVVKSPDSTDSFGPFMDRTEVGEWIATWLLTAPDDAQVSMHRLSR